MILKKSFSFLGTTVSLLLNEICKSPPSSGRPPLFNRSSDVTRIKLTDFFSHCLSEIEYNTSLMPVLLKFPNNDKFCLNT